MADIVTETTVKVCSVAVIFWSLNFWIWQPTLTTCSPNLLFVCLSIVKPAPDTLDGCVSSKAEKKSDKVAENGNSTPTVEFTVNTQNGNGKKEDADDNSELAEDTEPELYFTPKVSLPLVDVNTLEDKEEVVVEL